MASKNETGHNKNAANFNTLYSILIEMGSLYNPTNANLQLSNLDIVKSNLQGAIENLNNSMPAYKNAVAARETVIAPLNKLMTQTLNYAKSLNIHLADKENITSQVKKIRGDKKPKTINPETNEPEGISTSQLSYDNRIANLDALISQLSSHPEYLPNEDPISIVKLTDYKAQLSNLSNAVNVAGNVLITARKNRNQVLYNDKNNVIQLVKDIKAYIKSLGEEGKPYYKAIVKLSFIGI